VVQRPGRPRQLRRQSPERLDHPAGDLTECSVPIWEWLRRRASSIASTTTRRAWSVNRSNILPPDSGGVEPQQQVLGAARTLQRLQRHGQAITPHAGDSGPASLERGAGRQPPNAIVTSDSQ
jgi:hypothetical protein